MMISTTSGKLSKHDSILVDLYISVHFFKEKHETLGASGNPPDFSAPCSERSRSRRALLPCNPKHPTVLTAMHIPCIFPLTSFNGKEKNVEQKLTVERKKRYCPSCLPL